MTDTDQKIDLDSITELDFEFEHSCEKSLWADPFTRKGTRPCGKTPAVWHVTYKPVRRCGTPRKRMTAFWCESCWRRAVASMDYYCLVCEATHHWSISEELQHAERIR